MTFDSIGATGWYDMQYLLWDDPHEWLENYHMRSISEMVNSMVKCRFGAATRGNGLIRGRKLRRGSKLVGHNIRRAPVSGGDV